MPDWLSGKVIFLHSGVKSVIRRMPPGALVAP
jgi:hypothetical protein